MDAPTEPPFTDEFVWQVGGLSAFGAVVLLVITLVIFYKCLIAGSPCNRLGARIRCCKKEDALRSVDAEAPSKRSSKRLVFHSGANSSNSSNSRNPAPEPSVVTAAAPESPAGVAKTQPKTDPVELARRVLDANGNIKDGVSADEVIMAINKGLMREQKDNESIDDVASNWNEAVVEDSREPSRTSRKRGGPTSGVSGVSGYEDLPIFAGDD